LLLKTDQGSFTNTFRVPTGGAGTIFRVDNSGAVPIPDNNPAGAISSVVVSNITAAVAKVTVSLYLTHTFDSDLTISLISPGGITNVLSAHNGSFGDNYGFACSPDSRRTTFDDDSRFSITGASAPFIGTFSPEQPLSVFAGANGTNVNGTWTLHVVDDAAFDIGTLQCWSLSLTVPSCSDGGGECPGSDLAIGMTASPEPVLVGNNLTYAISVTNRGPTTAKNVVVSHLLPSSVIFVSANTSQGGYSQSGGAVSISFGTVPAGSRCSATVVVQPTVQGTLTSSATVTSSQFDPDLSNNTITIVSHASPPSAELTVGLGASPEPVLVGGSLTYSVVVTNNGPSFATGVTVTNILPPSMTILSANISQGSLNVFSNIVVLNVGSLSNSARATASILVTPNVEGSLTATSIVSAIQIDPITTNNIATFTSTVGQASDLELTLVDSPDPAVVRSNVTYIMTVTNHGPNIATSVILSQTLPAGVTMVSNSTSQGTILRNGNALTANIGTLGLGAGASIVVVVNPPNATTLSTVATVSSSQADPNTANNTVTATTIVAPPFVSILPSGTVITFESLTPTNGAVDIGETVGVVLRLRNAGNVINTNLTATLLTNNGVIPDPGVANVQNYGVLPAGGAPVGLPFRFKAVGTNGGSVSAVLQLQDGPNNLATATFNFGLPNIFNFSNTNAITIRDNSSALPYPSTIAVSGITGIVGKVTATLVNASHTFPQDVDALLVGASAQKTILMSGAGAAPLANATVTFDDSAAPLPDGSAQINTGSYHPASYLPGLNLPPPARAGPYLAAMSVFNNANPNGTWSLYIADHSAGDSGAVAGGWNLALTTISPVNQLADLSLVATALPNPALVGSPLTNIFTIVNNGPNDAGFVTFTDPLPAGVTLISAASSRGSVITGSGNVSANVGPLSAGQSATVTIAFIPSPANVGSLANVAGVSSTETDLNPANNSATASATVNLPVADLVLTQAGPTNPIVVGGNLTATFALTNNGPRSALNAVISNTLPAGLGFISATSSVGVASFAGGTVVADLGTLAPGAWAIVTLNASATSVGTFTNVAVASSLSTDPSPANNSAAAQIIIVNPSPSIVSAGARLISESLSPGNGAVDNGETVTVSLALRNVGSADTANLTATLQNSGGVTPVGGAQKSYGQLIHGGTAVNNAFTFAASGGNGGVVVASLVLQDGARSLGTVTFSFDLPATTTFANSAAIVIPDHGSAVPYPATINVSGLTGAVSRARVTLNGLTHSFPRDVNVLLVSPNGANVILMSHIGGAHAVTNLTLTFDDSAPATLSDSALLSGTMKPAAFGTVTFPPPAPAKGYGAALAAVTGGSPNGSWSLFVLDDSVGDAGNIASGWSLELTTLNPVNPIADLSVIIVSAPASVFVGGVYTNTVTVHNAGPDLATGISVTSTLPAGVSLVSASSSQGTVGGLVNGQVIATLGNIASAANANLSLVLAPSGVGTLTNDVSVAALETDLNVGNNTAESIVFVTSVTSAILSSSITNGQFALTIQAQPNSTYVIQASTNLTTWVSISTNTASAGGSIKFTDPSPLGSQRYYRTVRLQP